MVPGVVSHLEFQHELPGYTAFLRRLASFARVIAFDKRGQGLSDRITGAPSLEQRMDDVRAVMEAVGSRRAAIVGFSEGCAMSALFAATYPELVSHLVLFGGFTRAADRAPRRQTRGEDRAASCQPGAAASMIRHRLARPRPPIPRPSRQFGKLERLSASPGALKAIMLAQRPDRRRADPALGAGADPGAAPPDRPRRCRSALGAQTGGGDPRRPLHRISRRRPRLLDRRHRGRCWATSRSSSPASARAPRASSSAVLATVLFTDIVDSTRRAAELGDQKWRGVLDSHDQLAKQSVERHRGTLVKTTGDGILATFDGPGRAVRCALAFSSAAGQLGIPLRAGLHTGEIEMRGRDIGGIAVHAAARVMAQAGPGETLVSRVVTDLVAGAGLGFAERGSHELKGIPGRWELFAASV